MFDCAKHIDLVIKASKNLETHELDIFLKDIVGMSDNEVIIMKKLLCSENIIKENVVETTEYINPQIVAMIDYVKKNYKKNNLVYVSDIGNKYGFDFEETLSILKKNQMRKYACGFVVSDEEKNKIIEDVKSNPMKYSCYDLMMKYDVHTQNIYNWLKKAGVRDKVKAGVKGRQSNYSMSNAELRAEITAFADNN